MSNEALGHIWRFSPHSGPKFLVLVAIADVVNDQNDNEVWFSLANLGKKCRLARSTVANAVKELEEEGWLTRIQSNPGQTVRYQFQFIDGDVIWDSRPQRVSATRTGVVRQPDRGSPPHGHNTNINQTQTNATPTGVQALVNLYMKSFVGEFRPSGGQVAGQIQYALKKATPERLAELIPIIAAEGKPLTANTLSYVANRQPEVKSQPTPTPPPFTALDAPTGVPMPDNVRILAGFRKPPQN